MHIPGIDDELFIRGKVPMTKQEVRMITLCKAAIKENDIVLDIGAGTGSLSIEAALMAVQGHVYAVERNPEAVGLIKQNAVKFKVTANVSIIEGLAPDALKGIDNYDVVFIGGSGGNLEEILDVVSAHINPGGRGPARGGGDHRGALPLEGDQAGLPHLDPPSHRGPAGSPDPGGLPGLQLPLGA